MVMDLKVDRQGNIVFPVQYVTGVEAFEQQLMLRLHAFHDELIGQALPEPNIIRRLEVEAERIVSTFEDVEELVSFDAERAGPNSYDVRIRYRADGMRVLNRQLNADITPDLTPNHEDFLE